MFTPTDWLLFHAVIVVLLVIDLGIIHKRAHIPSLFEASVWSLVWIIAAVLFGFYIYLLLGEGSALSFATAYIVEKSLSMDNLFVFAVIFNYFGIELKYQHKVLFWGILGAIITRATFIFAGVRLIESFSWAIYIFGALLIYAGLRIARKGEDKVDPGRNPIVRQARRFLPITDTFHGDKFLVNKGGKVAATPLLLALIAIESTDIFFAIDSVPAVLAITTDIFIAYTSNIFAILGLRALYFLIIQLLLRLRYLHLGLAIILVYLGVKMLASSVVKIPTIISLIFVLVILASAALASLLIRPKKLSKLSPSSNYL